MCVGLIRRPEFRRNRMLREGARARARLRADERTGVVFLARGVDARDAQPRCQFPLRRELVIRLAVDRDLPIDGEEGILLIDGRRPGRAGDW